MTRSDQECPTHRHGDPDILGGHGRVVLRCVLQGTRHGEHLAVVNGEPVRWRVGLQ